MKKKILFIISSMGVGGVSKSLTTLMNVIDRNRYDISLMIVSPEGELKELLPADLHIITNPVWANLTQRLPGVWGLLKLGRPLLALTHIIRLCISVISKSKSAEMIAWMMPAVKEKFDVVVDYNGQQQLYYMINKLKADKKITFFHSDYEKWPYYYKADRKYYPKTDYVFTISEKCVDSIIKFFPEIKSKVRLMENISSRNFIDKLSEKEAPEISTDCLSLITLGRVCENKGIIWAIEVANILKSKGIDFKWYFLGPVDKLKEYEAFSKSLNVIDEIIFLGSRTNPYPYLRKADIVVHPSKFEGRSIALDEAKLLCKPIVVTNFSTVNDQFTDRYNASICEMNSQSIADTICELYGNSDLQCLYVANLNSEAHDNISEIEKLYQIFDD